MGDLNYRVQGNRRAVDLALKESMLDVLRANDQLAKEMVLGKTFQVKIVWDSLSHRWPSSG